MDKEIIQLLKSSDPRDRIAGIQDLVDSGHPDALKIIGALYKKETDARVKQVAKQAGRDLQQAQAPASSAVSSGGAKVKRDPDAAQKYLESAMGALIDLRNDEAWELAAKAFQADPELANDDYATGLASEITGLERELAVEELMRSAVSPTSEKAKNSDKAKNEDVERVGWGKALIGVGIYSVLVALIASIPFFVFSSLIGTIVEAATALDPTANVNASEVALASGALSGIGVGIGFGALFATFIGIMIQYGLVHFSATTFLGGVGYYTNLLYNMRVPLIAQLIVQTVIVAIIFGTLFSSLSTIDPVALEAASQTGDMTMIPGVEQNLNLINALNGLNALIGLGFLVWTCSIIGKTYQFSGVKGCVSIFISNIILFVGFCGCYFAIFTAFAGAFTNVQ